jgi:hypothetical protein
MRHAQHAVECEEWVKAAQAEAAAARAEAAAARLSEPEIQQRKLARRLAYVFVAIIGSPEPHIMSHKFAPFVSIFRKLTELGYGDVLEAMGTNSFSTHPPLSDHPLINSAQFLWRKGTLRVFVTFLCLIDVSQLVAEWKKIEPDIVSHMREMRNILMN